MKSYSQRVRDAILPRSIGDSLPAAFEEWSFTENTVDHENPIETCGLCGQEDLRYHFEVRNAVTKHTLWVGSQCILKFGLSVFEDGRKLDKAQAKKKLDRLTQQMRLNSCLRALTKLAAAEANDILQNALEYYSKKKYLTPQQAFVVLWRLQTNGVDHSPSFFKINLKRSKYKDDLRVMKTSHVHRIWPVLTAAQKAIAQSFGHEPPTDG